MSASRRPTRLAAGLLTLTLLVPAAPPALAVPGPPRAKVRVITTVPDLASIAQAVGGNLVSVEAIARGYQDPHYVEAKPSYIVKMSRADLVLMVGMQLEIGWLPLLIQGSRNPDLQSVAVNDGISVLQKPEGEVSRQFGDIHPEGNPHYTLDPRNGRVIAQNIAKALKGFVGPQEQAQIDENLATFIAELDRRIPEWERRLAPWKGMEYVAYHQQFEYLAAWAGWKTVAYIEEKPGISPSPQHMAEVEDLIKGRGIKLVLSSSFISPKIPDRIAKGTGTRYLALPAAVSAEDGITDYFALFDTIITMIEHDVPKP